MLWQLTISDPNYMDHQHLSMQILKVHDSYSISLIYEVFNISYQNSNSISNYVNVITSEKFKNLTNFLSDLKRKQINLLGTPKHYIDVVLSFNQSPINIKTCLINFAWCMNKLFINLIKKSITQQNLFWVQSA